MVDKATTWGALLDRRRDVSFIGREQVLANFRLNMVYEVPPTLLFYISGPEGVGKSALLVRYRALAEEHGFLTAWVDEAQSRADAESAVLAAMEAIAQQFADQGTPLTTFSEQYADYLDALDAIAEDPQAPAPPLDWFEGLSAGGEWHQRFWTPYLATRFSTRLLPVLRQPVESLTSVFVSDLNAWASIRDLVLFFDDWQALGLGVSTWLIELLQKGTLHINVWLVVADVEPPGERWKKLAPVMQSQCLGPLRETDIRAYGQVHPGLGWDEPAKALAVTQGMPFFLDMLAEAEAPIASSEDPSLEMSSPLMRYLASLEGLQREAMLRSAAARRLTSRVMTVLMDEEGSEAFDWLKRSSLVIPQGDAWVYHSRVRERMRTWSHQQQPDAWLGAHRALAAYYETLSEDAFERGRGRIARRWTRNREWLYHRLIAGGEEGCDEAQQAFLDALRTDYRWAAEVVAVCKAASETPGVSDAVTTWASRLTQGWEALRSRDWEAALAFVDAILEGETLREPLEPAFRRLRNWIAGRLGLPLEEAAAAPAPESEAPSADQEMEPAVQKTEPAVQQTEPAVQEAKPAETTFEPAGPSRESGESPASGEPHTATPEAAGDRMVAKAQETCERANALFKEGDYLSAIQIYSRAVDQDPSSVSAYFNRGLTHLKLKEIVAAIDDFSQVLSLDPDNPSAHYQRGMAYLRRGELTLAIEDFDAAISLMPESATLYAQRASAYYRLQAYQRALDDYTKAIAHKPTDVTFVLNRGLTYMALSEVERAIEDYDQAIEQAPENALAYYYRGQAWMEQGDEEQALADFEQALRIDPDNAQIHTGLGMAHARMLDFDQALDAYERAMALDSENARTYYNAACAAALNEREEKALAWLERAITLRSQYRIMAQQDPDFSFVRDHPAFQRITSE